jgi:hypothetical protein
MGVVETIALTMGIAWASGINLYATIATLGLLGATGNMDLPPDLVVLSDPLVIGAAGFMYFVEFLLIRPPGSIPAGIPCTPSFASRQALFWLLVPLVMWVLVQNSPQPSRAAP